MSAESGKIIKVPFENLYLDPNNPRISPLDRPGYDDPTKIFDDTIQSKLYERVNEIYDVGDLISSILTQGWVPIDQMLVWEHHEAKGKYIILEGNTRKTALNQIRENRFPREKKKLERISKNAKGFATKDLKDQEGLVTKISDVIDETAELDVLVVDARNTKELEEKLPRLLAVRHVSHAKEWSPYALNLYILSLYERLFIERYKSLEDLRLEADLIRQVSDMVSLSYTKTRRNLQAASAFSKFKRDFEDQLSEGDKFSDSDQFYFDEILSRKYAYEQFGLTNDKLHLEDEMAQALFEWAFKYPRGQGDESQNILRKAKDIGLWAKMKKYDDEKGTSFASRLNVEEPDKAVKMDLLEAQYQNHKVSVSPIENIESLLETFGEIKADQLLEQASHLKPMLEQLKTKSEQYLKLIEASKD
jgi:hypothetical protein